LRAAVSQCLPPRRARARLRHLRATSLLFAERLSAQRRIDRRRRCRPFTGGHDATAQAVYHGSADAGGIELRILHRLERQGTVPAGALRVIETRNVMGYPWVAREGLGAAAREKIVRTFTAINDPALLDLMRAKRYVTVTAADYSDIRGHATELGLLTVSG